MSFFDLVSEMGMGEFFGTGPIPPESVARAILHIPPEAPLNTAGVKAAYRHHVRCLRPDMVRVPDADMDRLRVRQLGDGDVAGRLAELMWARDDLLRRVPPPVTASTASGGRDSSRYAAQKRCKGCDDQRRREDGEPYWKHLYPSRWAGYCWPCAHDAENQRQRDLRRARRADRSCAACGSAFTPARSDGLYCSSRCRQQAHRRRRHEERRAG